MFLSSKKLQMEKSEEQGISQEELEKAALEGEPYAQLVFRDNKHKSANN